MIEDSENDAMLIQRHLRNAGYDLNCKRVENRAELAVALERKYWDLVLSDYSMPEFSPLEALVMLREADMDVPVIIISGTIGEDVAVSALRAGAHDFVVKGNLTRLVPAIERELDEQKQRLARRKAEVALMQSEERFRALIEHSSDIITVTDAAWNVTYMSPTAQRILGLAPAEVVGKCWLDFMHADDRPAVEQILRQAVNFADQSFHFEVRCRHSDGRYLWFNSAATNLLSHFAVGGVVINSRDVTASKQTEKALREATEQLETAAQKAAAAAAEPVLASVSEPVAEPATQLPAAGSGVSTDRVEGCPPALVQMAAGLRHDLGQVVASVAEVSMDVAEGNTAVAADRLRQIAQDAFLLLRRLSAFKDGAPQSKVDINRLAERAIGLAAPYWKQAGVDIKVSETYGNVALVMGHERALLDAVCNVIFNALEAMPKGGELFVSTDTMRFDLAQPTIFLEIRDTGTGMDAYTVSHCLEPFFTTRAPDHVGLGLTAAAGIMGSHHGRIDISTEPRQGTTVRLVFPVYRPGTSCTTCFDG
jgi:PAS domain S-box-containing protein